MNQSPDSPDANDPAAAALGAGFEQMARWTRLWMDLATQMMSAPPPAVDLGANPVEAMRQTRTAMLESMSHAADRLLRSPEYLELNRLTSQAAFTALRQANETMTQLRRGTQGVARQDVQAVSQAVRQAEQRVLDRIEELSLKIDDLADDLRRHVAGEAAGSEAAPSAGRTARPPRRGAAVCAPGRPADTASAPGVGDAVAPVPGNGQE
jgi:hypothetical protein